MAIRPRHRSGEIFLFGVSGICVTSNPVGVHSNGMLGESQKGTQNNLFSYIANVAIDNLAILSVCGSDYATRNGTGMHDYMHNVVDLALGHVRAFLRVLKSEILFNINLVTRSDYNVLEVIRAYAEISIRQIDYQIVARRPDDIAECYADVKLAERLLDWRVERKLADMFRDS